MLRLRAPVQSNVLTPACFEHSWKGIQENEIWYDSNVVLCRSMSATGQSRRFRDVGREFALPPTTDIVRLTWRARGRLSRGHNLR
jgi:hypothetical protein